MCFTDEQRCDGDVQCKYGEDEKNCDGKCREGALWCEGKKKCVPKWEICDGVQNCPDGKDEMVRNVRDSVLALEILSNTNEKSER